ncbi:hypothetical protein EV426DRAFT_710416 [Tirmania nivea]|nr:hypothetical protein EV426DRAFT_710416 [Tirmania nivea]
MTNSDQDLVVRAIYAETPQAVEVELPRETSIEDARRLAFNELQKLLHGIQKYVSINLDDDHTEVLPVDPHIGGTPPKESTTVEMPYSAYKIQTQGLIALATQPKTKQQKKKARKKAAKQKQQNTVSGTYKTIGEALDALYALLLQGLQPGDALVEAAFKEARRLADLSEKRVLELEKRVEELEAKVEELEAKVEEAAVEREEAALEKRANDLCVRQLLNESRDKFAQLSKYKGWEDIVQVGERRDAHPPELNQSPLRMGYGNY